MNAYIPTAKERAEAFFNGGFKLEDKCPTLSFSKEPRRSFLSPKERRDPFYVLGAVGFPKDMKPRLVNRHSQ